MMWIVSLIAGTLFGAGLTISGMVNPEKILDFLDFAAIPSGNWDPTLAVVFASAVGTMALTYLYQTRMTSPMLAKQFFLPNRRDIDVPLIAGASLFGVGWGLAGVCPGPGIVALAIAQTHIVEFGAFVVALVFGIMLRMGTRTSVPATISEAGAKV